MTLFFPARHVKVTVADPKENAKDTLLAQILLLPLATVVVERLCFYRCLSVHGGGIHPPGRHPPEQTPLGRHPPLGALGRHPWADPSGQPPSEKATGMDGKHPVGMHFYFHAVFNIYFAKLVVCPVTQLVLCGIWSTACSITYMLQP